MGFNITAQTNETFDEILWFYSDGHPKSKEVARLEEAYVEVHSMFIADTPFVLILADESEKKPRYGEIARNVFFCQPDRIRFSHLTLFNSSFWSKCYPDFNFSETLLDIADLLSSPNISPRFTEWNNQCALHCINVWD